MVEYQISFVPNRSTPSGLGDIRSTGTGGPVLGRRVTSKLRVAFSVPLFPHFKNDQIFCVGKKYDGQVLKKTPPP